MKKYWSLVADEADKLFVAGIATKNDDLILSAGRLRGTALLAALDPGPVEALPAVRPLKAARRAARGTRPELTARAFTKSCSSCNAPAGSPCVAVRANPQGKAGETLRYIHGERTGGNRSLRNTPT